VGTPLINGPDLVPTLAVITPLEVGFYHAGYLDIVSHADPIAACTDFIYREAVWVLRRKRVM